MRHLNTNITAIIKPAEKLNPLQMDTRCWSLRTSYMYVSRVMSNRFLERGHCFICRWNVLKPVLYFIFHTVFNFMLYFLTLIAYLSQCEGAFITKIISNINTPCVNFAYRQNCGFVNHKHVQSCQPNRLSCQLVNKDGHLWKQSHL